MNSNKQGLVAAGHPATAEAGADILRAGGNAVDAAIAAITTSFIAEPVLTSAGGGGFMLLFDPSSHQSRLYDGFARMPFGKPLTGIEPELKAIPIDFGDTVQSFHIGQASVGTPSLLAMLFQAHREQGKLPLKEVLAPGLDAARSGIRLNQLQSSFIKLLTPILTDTEACRILHTTTRKGELSETLWQEGESFCNPDLANTLEMLAIEGIDEMYQGDLAKEIVKACTPYGLLGMDDMRAKQVEVRTPLSIELLGGTLLTNPPPSSGGLLIAYASIMLERLYRSDQTSNTPWPVLAAEGLRAASQLRRESFDQRIHDKNIIAQLLDTAHQEKNIANVFSRFHSMQKEPDNRHGSTTHISVVDSNGMAVSMTSSNGEGSGIVVPGTGIHLNNMLGEADINPLGFHALAGGTTLSSMMAPSIFLEQGNPSLVLGSGGSNRLRGAILQVLLRNRLLGEDIESAIHAPRLHNEGNELDIEPAFLTDQERELLMQLGWKLRDWQQQSVYFGGVHAITRNSLGELHGCGDPRRGGAVAFA